jgi:multicomponent Na+:H+ antiporter subunit F
VSDLFAAAAVSLLLVGLASVFRLVAGPSPFDRIVGLAGFTANATTALLLVGLAFGQLEHFVDLALGYAMLGFVGALAGARYFERGGR